MVVMGMGETCPTCGDEFGSRGVATHHQSSHGEPFYDALIRERFGMEPAAWLEEQYHGGEKSLSQLADILGCANASSVSSIMERHGVDRRKSTRDMPPWFGTTAKGHEAIKTNMGSRGRGHVYVHRLVAVAEHGVDAVAGMDVHHKNGVPWDNRPENLELKDHAQHRREHAFKEHERR